MTQRKSKKQKSKPTLNVVPFKPFAQLINQDVVRQLEFYLAKAKAGEYAAIGIAAVAPDDTIISSYVPGDNKAYQLIGCITCLNQRLIKQFGWDDSTP